MKSDEKELTAKIIADLEAKRAAGEEEIPLAEALPMTPTDLSPAPDTTLIQNTPQPNDPSMN